MQYYTQRDEVAYFMRRLYEHGLTTTSGGNVSLRLEKDLIAITPAALDKGRMTGDQVALMSFDGTNLTPELKSSSESPMHIEIYKRHPHAGAVVHAHPPTASAFCAAASPIQTRLLAESYYMLGDVARAGYFLTGAKPLAKAVAKSLDGHRVTLMQNHGVTAIGASLLEAFDRMELIEAAARMTLVARQLDHVTLLDDAQCAELDELLAKNTKRTIPNE